MYADIRQIIDDVRNNWKAVSERYQYAKSRFFYHQDFISLLLFNRSHRQLPKTLFIDYNLAFQYYAADRKVLQLKYQGEDKSIELPYAEIINFIDQPGATIQVEDGVGQYRQSEEIINTTKGAFAAFMADRPKTTNGPALRMADLQAQDDGRYTARLEASGYYDEVRTALSLDYPLDNDLFETMRIKDMTDEGNLRPIGESLLVNTIGVFTAVMLYSDGNWYFHMMPRQNKLGVFGGMLSSVSGGVEPPPGPIDELVSYMTTEIKREFHEETGLDIRELEGSGRASVVPLAFTRELSRGGKPQFFYLTVLHDITEKEFGQAFKTAQWKSEFRNDLFSNIKAIDDVVSPEFSTALFYAITYLQKRRKLPVDPLVLP